MAQSASQSARKIDFCLRNAHLEDAPALSALEDSVFDPNKYPKMSTRQFRHLLTKGNAQIILAENKNKIIGSIVMLFRANSRMARLYSIAVHPDFQGGVIGKALFERGETAGIEHGCQRIKLEIRSDNHRHLKRYLTRGYVQTGKLADYYPDHQTGIKLVKSLADKRP